MTITVSDRNFIIEWREDYEAGYHAALKSPDTIAILCPWHENANRMSAWLLGWSLGLRERK